MAFTAERVRRHRASSPKGSSSDGCSLFITMDQLTCASFFPHPLYYYWYEVGMLKVLLVFSIGGGYCRLDTVLILIVALNRYRVPSVPWNEKLQKLGASIKI